MHRKGTRRSAGVFVTGTDTGVGKTLVTATLALGLMRLGRAVGVMKPIETGVSPFSVERSDAARLRAAIESEETLGAICPYQFEQPVAPLAAASAERRSIDPGVIRQVYRLLASRYDVVVVEGVGGVRVPITPKTDVADLIVTLKLPAIVVARTGLGGINHALLTIDALRRQPYRRAVFQAIGPFNCPPACYWRLPPIASIRAATPPSRRSAAAFRPSRSVFSPPCSASRRPCLRARRASAGAMRSRPGARSCCTCARSAR